MDCGSAGNHIFFTKSALSQCEGYKLLIEVSRDKLFLPLKYYSIHFLNSNQNQEIGTQDKIQTKYWNQMSYKTKYNSEDQ